MTRSILTLPYNDHLFIDEMVCSGVSVGVLREIADLLEIDNKALSKGMHLSPRTLERRLAGNKKVLPFGEGERTLRIGRLYAKTIEVLQSVAEARIWFTEPLDIFGGKSPLELSATDAGGRAVEESLGRIEHGVFA